MQGTREGIIRHVQTLQVNGVDVQQYQEKRMCPRPSFCPVANCYWYTNGHNGEGQSSHVPVFCVKFEKQTIFAFT